MKRSPQEPERAVPPAVRDGLARACELVEANGAGWTVGGLRAGPEGSSLADALYLGWYTQPAAAPPPADDPPLHCRTLLTALRAAHAGAASVSTGWTVRAANPRGALAAVDGERSRTLRPGEYRMPLRPGTPPAPGEPVEPLARADDLDAERGLWWAFGGPGDLEAPIGRLYLNARPATAPRVIREVTAALAPFAHRLKCPILAEAFGRVDAIVAYHERGAREGVLAALAERRERLDPLLDPAVPPLTCPVRPGLAWADDVETGLSYGEARCNALAAAIERAPEDWRARDREGRLELLLAGLREAGVDPQRPWEAGR
jgi:hypothetical protein